MLWLIWLTGCLLFFSIFLNGLATWRAWSFIKRRSAPQKSLLSKPPVTLLIPVCGVEGTEGERVEHFLRFSQLDWPQYQVIFTVLKDSDPAVPLLQQILSSPTCTVNLQMGGIATGANPKVRNLLNALPLVRHEWIVICDADVKPEPSFLEGLMAPFLESDASYSSRIEQDSHVGLVHSLYRCLEDTTLASSWEHVWVNCDFWAQGLLGDWLRGTNFAFGATMAFHRNTLEQIGGLESIQDYLADDYQLGNRVAKLGKDLIFNREFVTLQSTPQSWSETWQHLLRWSRTIRVCQPGGFATSIVTNITLFAFLALFVDRTLFLPWSMGAFILRVWWANQCRNWITGRQGLWNRCWLIPFKDLAQAVLWVLAFWNGPVEWRGVRYKLGSDGKLRIS